MTSGNNGAFPAGSGYDMATGLGTPIASGASGLVAQLCAAATGVRHRLDQCSRGAVRHGAERVGRAARDRRDALRRQLRRRRVGVVRHGGGERRHRLELEHAAGDRPAGNRRRRRARQDPERHERAQRRRPLHVRADGGDRRPGTGAVYTQTQVVNAQFTCAASAPGSASCAGADRVRLADRHVRGRSAPVQRHRDRLPRGAGLARRRATRSSRRRRRASPSRARVRRTPGGAGSPRVTSAPRQRPSYSRPAPARWPPARRSTPRPRARTPSRSPQPTPTASAGRSLIPTAWSRARAR